MIISYKVPVILNYIQTIVKENRTIFRDFYNWKSISYEKTNSNQFLNFSFSGEVNMARSHSKTMLTWKVSKISKNYPHGL